MSSPTPTSTSNASSIRTNVGTVLAPQKGHIDQQDMSYEETLNRLEIETRLKEGAENLLQVLDTRTREIPKETREARRIQVTEELNQTNARIASLRARIAVLTAPYSDLKIYRGQRSEEKLSNRPKLATIKSYSSTKYATDADDTEANFTDRVTSLTRSDQEPSYYITRANEFTTFLHSRSNSREEICQPALASAIIQYCSSTISKIVGAGYRMARYCLSDNYTADFIMSFGMERCFIMSMSRDHRFSIEREQAIKFVRSLYNVASELITPGIIRALVSLAESQDRLALICLETLAELALIMPELSAAHGAHRCLLDSLVDGPITLADEIAMVFVHGLDHPATRTHIRAGRDLEVIFAPFTEFIAGSKQPALEERLLISTTVVARMLNTWPGLLGLSMYHLQGLKSIVDALRVPASSIRDSILEFLFHVLAIPLNNVSSTFLAGRRLTTLGRTPLAAGLAGQQRINGASAKNNRYAGLMNQFAALKLLLFLEVGILDALTMVVEDKLDTQAARKATLLVGELLQLSNTLLPLAKCRTLQSLPRLFSSAADLEAHGRSGATAALFQIESLNRTRNKSIVARIVSSPDKRGQRQVEQVKIKMGLQIDDSHFRNLLLDTQVLSTKNYTKWHWDTLTELVQGPLLNPKRLEESIRATKFMKRLLAFYRPFTHRFSAIRNTKPNQKYVKFGCLLLTTLLANPEGVKYLTDSKLLRQLSECLAQMDPMIHVTATDTLFSRSRLEDTLSHGYFDMIGVLTTHPQGVAMMERWRIFSSLYHLTDLRSRGDLVKLFLTHMDYTYEGHCRIILSKALTTGLLDVRLFATEHLRNLISEPVENVKETAKWAIRLLIIQLYDTNTEVCETAVKVLQAACSSRDHLQYIVQLRPALEHLGEIGGPLLLRFLATSVGFHYLKELHYIDQEMDDWFHGRNDEYVTQLESALLDMTAPHSSAEPNTFRGEIPVHFYGEVASTEEGVALLLAKGHFTRYVDVLQSHWQEASDPLVIHKVKAALWAIGSIGATERGAPFLKDCRVIMSIVNIATRSEVSTLKGTAYFVIGMLSSTMIGVELLREYRWDAVLTNMGCPTGICVPQDINDVLNLQPWSDAPDRDILAGNKRISMHDPLSKEIFLGMSNLGNHILANEAAKTLLKLRQKYPNKFMDLGVYDEAFDLLAKYGYKLGVRKFLIDLFEPDMLATYMLRRIQPVRPNRGYSLPKEMVGKQEYEISTVSSSSPEHNTSLDLHPNIRTKVRAHRAATIGS